LKTLKLHIVWNPVSSPHSKKPTDGMYFGTVGCSPHFT